MRGPFDEFSEKNVEPGEDELLLLLRRRRRLLCGDGKEGGGKLRGQQWAARVKLAAASLSVPRHQQGLHHVQQLAKELGRNTG